MPLEKSREYKFIEPSYYFFILLFSLIFSFFAAPVFSADNLYDGFKNPPVSARPIGRWCWDGNNPDEKAITRELESFKKAGFGGIEIVIREDVNAALIKFAADKAKEAGLAFDLQIHPSSKSSFNSKSGHSWKIILFKKSFTGPTNTAINVRELINESVDANGRLMFLRLAPANMKKFSPGEELRKKIRPDGTIPIDINDSNDYILYTGAIVPNAQVPDMLNLDGSSAYFSYLLEKFRNVYGGKLENIRTITFPEIDLSVSNWTEGFGERFFKKYDYKILEYLPFILDSNITGLKNPFTDTIRRTRFDYYQFLAEIYRENFTKTFQKFCRDNGVQSCVPAGPVYILDSCSVPTDVIRAYSLEEGDNQYQIWNKIASSESHLPGKSVIEGLINHSNEKLPNDSDILFACGLNRLIARCGLNFASTKMQDWTGRTARLSNLFQNAEYQARIAILYPAADLWSDCGPSQANMANNFWYLYPLWQALNQNGYTSDIINDQDLAKASYEDGKLHCGSKTFDAVIVPDVFSIEFPAVKALRFFAEKGGKVAFIGKSPLTSTGYKDMIRRSVSVDVTMRHLEGNEVNSVLFVPAPEKNKDKLVPWASDLMKKISVPPNVKISPLNDNLIFAQYKAEERDIFYFVNTDEKSAISFNLKNISGKTPWIWNFENGQRQKFTNRNKSGDLNIKINPTDSLLIVFEPK